MKTAFFWTRLTHEKSHEWKLVECQDPSHVPLAAWKSLNKKFWEWKEKCLLWPLDEMDCYQFVVGEMIRTADNLPELKRASPETYLVSTAFFALMKYHARVVQTTRDEHGAIRDLTTDAQAFVEELLGPDAFDATTRAGRARACVYETLPKLKRDTQRGLYAFLMADGRYSDAAMIYGCSLPWYMAKFKKKWASEFRKACTWQW